MRRKKHVTSKAQREAAKRYEAKCKHFIIRLRYGIDEDIIRWLAEQENASQAVKDLIRNNFDKVAK